MSCEYLKWTWGIFSLYKIKMFFTGINKKQQTISQIQTTNSWSKTQSGVRPEKRYIFQDVVNRVKENPDKKFSMSDVWAPSNLVTIISKFNRHPSMTSAITHLNFANGLIFWFPSGLDETFYHWVREDGIWSKATAEICPCLKIGP